MTNLIALPSGTELVGDYRIERVLGAGGFGVTYLADEMALARLVTIKEYFPSDIAARTQGIGAAPRSQDCAGDYRWGLDRFIEEAQTLARFNHTNIVRVYRYFRANNTGYMVLHFEEGQSLKAWLKGLGRAPRQKELDAMIAPLLDALELIHKSDFLHRDIAPDNIIIRKAGDPVLIDFGSARGEIASHTKTVSALVKPGYSPYEQYAETSRRQGPWTDIYALGATLYHAVTGKRPPDAPSRMVNDEFVSAREAALGSYRAGFLKAIDRALVLNIEGRPQQIAAWRGDLLAPDPPRNGWLTRALEKKKDDAKAHATAEAVVDAAVTVLPPPDVPGPKGLMLDLLDGMRKKTEPVEAPADPPPEAAPEAKAEAPPAPEPPKKKSAPRIAPKKKPKRGPGPLISLSPAPKGFLLRPAKASQPKAPRSAGRKRILQ
jgi:serine/threonine protein kinase